jgi:hypothetical protein
MDACSAGCLLALLCRQTLACNQNRREANQVLIPKIEISLRQYDWSIIPGRALARFDSGKRTENILCRPTRPACCTFYLSNLITVQCSTVQYLPAQSNRWHSMHKITMPCLASALYLPSSHLSLKNPSSITSATAQATASSMYCNLLRMEKRTSKTPSKSRGACLASPSGSLILVYFAGA